MAAVLLSSVIAERWPYKLFIFKDMFQKCD
jgi:hypothetical protein